MLGEADLKIFVERFSEKARRPLFQDDMRVVPRFVLEFFSPDLPVHLKCKEVRSRELRIVGVLFRPVLQSFVGEFDVRNDAAVGRVSAGANEIVVERVVDAKITHLHPPEVFVAGRRGFEHLLNVLLPLRNLGSVFLFRIGRRRRLLGGRRFRSRSCCDGACNAKSNRRSRYGHKRAFQQQPFPG